MGEIKGNANSITHAGRKGYPMTLDAPAASPTIPSLLHDSCLAHTHGNRLRIGGTLEISGWDSKIGRKNKMDIGIASKLLS
jgi:hypothetical protein